MVGRVHRELTNEDIDRIARTYHAWRGELGEYVDIPGFCASVTTSQIAAHNCLLIPGLYVGAEEVVEDEEPLDKRLARLTSKLYSAFEENKRLELRVRAALERIDV
jgi:type I restriction enzyme M protein